MGSPSAVGPEQAVRAETPERGPRTDRCDRISATSTYGSRSAEPPLCDAAERHRGVGHQETSRMTRKDEGP